MIHILKSQKAEGYIDTVVGVLCVTMLLILSINTFSFLALKQDMDHMAKEVLQAATFEGRTDGLAQDRLAELEVETGISPELSWSAQYYDLSQTKVQIGETMKVVLVYRTAFKGFGALSIPLTLQASSSGISQKYWKD